MKEVSFSAPWGAPLVVMTGVCSVICLLIPVPGILICLGNSVFGMSSIPLWAGWIVVTVPILTLVVSATFMVRGYVLSDGCLSIKRLGWKTRFDLSRLTSATVDPNALQGSLRLFGNGGCFAFTGWFRNKQLGVYRAYATDPKKTVVLRFSDKTVVVTPDDPQKFVAEVNSSKIA